MDVQPSIVTLACGHKFHGSCIVQHLYVTTQCPICRNDPTHWDPGPRAVDPEPGLATERVTLHEALRKAKDDSTSNQVVARMFATLRAHKHNGKAARRALQRLMAKVAHHQDALDKRIQAYSEKAYTAHAKRHKNTLDAISEARKAITKSRNRVLASKRRIAGKYGYVES